MPVTPSDGVGVELPPMHQYLKQARLVSAKAAWMSIQFSLQTVTSRCIGLRRLVSTLVGWRQREGGSTTTIMMTPTRVNKAALLSATEPNKTKLTK